MEKECYDFLRNVMLVLLGTDNLFTYNFLTNELNISRTILSGLKNGRDLYIRHYVRVIKFVLPLIRLAISMELLLVEIRLVLSGHMDLMVCVVPHDKNKKGAPLEWVAIMWWEE